MQSHIFLSYSSEKSKWSHLLKKLMAPNFNYLCNAFRQLQALLISLQTPWKPQAANTFAETDVCQKSAITVWSSREEIILTVDAMKQACRTCHVLALIRFIATIVAIIIPITLPCYRDTLATVTTFKLIAGTVVDFNAILRELITSVIAIFKTVTKPFFQHTTTRILTFKLKENFLNHYCIAWHKDFSQIIWVQPFFNVLLTLIF